MKIELDVPDLDFNLGDDLLVTRCDSHIVCRVINIFGEYNVIVENGVPEIGGSCISVTVVVQEGSLSSRNTPIRPGTILYLDNDELEGGQWSHIDYEGKVWTEDTLDNIKQRSEEWELENNVTT